MSFKLDDPGAEAHGRGKIGRKKRGGRPSPRREKKEKKSVPAFHCSLTTEDLVAGERPGGFFAGKTQPLSG